MAQAAAVAQPVSDLPSLAQPTGVRQLHGALRAAATTLPHLCVNTRPSDLPLLHPKPTAARRLRGRRELHIPMV